MPIDFSVDRSGPAQKTGTKWFVNASIAPVPLFVGYTVSYKDGDGRHRGLAPYKHIAQIPDLRYDRITAEAEWGLWSHFVWPSVVAESSGGYHTLVNTYDRAWFTFGFYQLAAHTPDDNLILLFRELLGLPTAGDYFPDLTMFEGKVHQKVDSQSKSLETVTVVKRPNGKKEKQLRKFMSYLNPDTLNVDDREVLIAGKLMHWLINDPAAVAAAVRIPMRIMLRKIKRASASYKLTGRQPELAILVSDITHQGRGSPAQIRAALAKSGFEAQYNALRNIGSSNYTAARLRFTNTFRC